MVNGALSRGDVDGAKQALDQTFQRVGSEQQAGLNRQAEASQQALNRQAMFSNENQKAGLSQLDKMFTDPQHGYTQFLAQAQSTKNDIAKAQNGDELAASLAPLMTALGVTSFAGLHRINQTEVNSAGPQVGSLYRQVNAMLSKAGSGSLPADTTKEMGGLIDGLIDAKHASLIQGAQLVSRNNGLDPAKTTVMARDGSVDTLANVSKQSQQSQQSSQQGGMKVKDPGGQEIQTAATRTFQYNGHSLNTNPDGKGANTRELMGDNSPAQTLSIRCSDANAPPQTLTFDNAAQQKPVEPFADEFAKSFGLSGQGVSVGDMAKQTIQNIGNAAVQSYHQAQNVTGEAGKSAAGSPFSLALTIPNLITNGIEGMANLLHSGVPMALSDDPDTSKRGLARVLAGASQIALGMENPDGDLASRLTQYTPKTVEEMKAGTGQTAPFNALQGSMNRSVGAQVRDVRYGDPSKALIVEGINSPTTAGRLFGATQKLGELKPQLDSALSQATQAR